MFRFTCLCALLLVTLCRSDTTTQKPDASASTAKVDAKADDTVQIFEIINFNPLPMRIFEIGFSEFLRDQLLAEQFIRSPPVIEPYKQSETFSFKVRDANNTEVSQRWSAVVGYDNNTYVTKKFVKSKYVPDAQGKPTKVILDMKEDKFVVSPPDTQNGTVPLAATNRTLINFAQPKELIEEMTKLKKEMDAVFGKDVPLL